MNFSLVLLLSLEMKTFFLKIRFPAKKFTSSIPEGKLTSLIDFERLGLMFFYCIFVLDSTPTSLKLKDALDDMAYRASEIERDIFKVMPYFDQWKFGKFYFQVHSK